MRRSRATFAALTAATLLETRGFYRSPNMFGARIITGAVARQIDVIATNSDGDPARREFLLGQLGPGATEQIVDPGEGIVGARLSDPETGILSPECGSGNRPLVFEEVDDVNEIRCAIEFREDETRQSPGRIVGSLLTYGKRARDRAEMFKPGALHWPAGGISS